jgi:hypothetical protein
MNFKKNVMRFLYFIKVAKSYSPYCPYCTSCGETGCCSPTVCISHPKGRYCETNIGELKVYYWTLKEFWDRLESNKYPEIEKLLDDIYCKNYDEQISYINNLPEKVNLFKRIKNKIFINSKCCT